MCSLPVKDLVKMLKTLFTVTINETPVADAPGNVEACDSYTLPALENGSYFASEGGVDPIEVGTEITVTQTIYVSLPVKVLVKLLRTLSL
jgi:hypothetical protein